MTWWSYLDKILQELGLTHKISYNTFQPPVGEYCWPLNLPKVNWAHTDCVILMFQDWMHVLNGIITELAEVERFYGDKADRVIVVHWPHALDRHYQGPINLMEFNVHEYDILNNLALRRDEWQDIWSMRWTRRWQCLNGRKCPHRLRTVQMLQDWPDGTVSLGEIVALPAYPYATYRGTSNEDNFVRLAPIYGQHLFNIVTETIYDYVPGIVSEKTFMAMLAGQLPLIIGYQGIVKDCKEMGFDMFDDVLDLSYDHIPNEHRVHAALINNKDIILNYDPSRKVRDRLRDQAVWLLEQWPSLALTSLKPQLQRIIKVQGWR